MAKRDYATQEARALLIERGADPALAEAAVSGFAARGFLDDTRFAEKYVSYAARRGLGPLRIARELRDRGIGPELLAAALQAGHDWPALCEDLRRRRFGAAGPKSWAEKGRQARFLQYRGFSSDHMRLSPGLDPIESPEND